MKRIWSLAVIALAACGSAPRRTEPAPRPAKMAPSPPGPRIEAADAEWQKRMEEHLRRHPTEADETRRRALALVDMARDYRAGGRYDKAEEACRQALDLWGECVEAQEILRDLRKFRGKE